MTKRWHISLGAVLVVAIVWAFWRRMAAKPAGTVKPKAATGTVTIDLPNVTVTSAKSLFSGGGAPTPVDPGDSTLATPAGYGSLLDDEAAALNPDADE